MIGRTLGRISNEWKWRYKFLITFRSFLSIVVVYSSSFDRRRSMMMVEKTSNLRSVVVVRRLVSGLEDSADLLHDVDQRRPCACSASSASSTSTIDCALAMDMLDGDSSYSGLLLWRNFLVSLLSPSLTQPGLRRDALWLTDWGCASSIGSIYSRPLA